MNRFALIMVALCCALSGVFLPSKALSQGTSIEATPEGVVITAGHPGNLTVNRGQGRPGSSSRGQSIYCGWYNFIGGFGSEVFYPIGRALKPKERVQYLFTCWTTDFDMPLSGYPVLRYFYGTNLVPPELVTTEDVADLAVKHLKLKNPRIALSPEKFQIVGIPTWLAVTSKLVYSKVTASAGPVWATADARFNRIVWSFGNGHKRTCSGLQNKVWNNSRGARQSSPCTYTYTDSKGSPFRLKATVVWDIWQRTNLRQSWHRWGTTSLTYEVDMPVVEMQAAIR